MSKSSTKRNRSPKKLAAPTSISISKSNSPEAHLLLQLDQLLIKTIFDEETHRRNIIRRQREFRSKLKYFKLNHPYWVKYLLKKRSKSRILEILGLYDSKTKKATFGKIPKIAPPYKSQLLPEERVSVLRDLTPEPPDKIPRKRSRSKKS